jgi:hypothetical protein
MPKLAGTCGSWFSGTSLCSTLPTALRSFYGSDTDWYRLADFECNQFIVNYRLSWDQFLSDIEP